MTTLTIFDLKGQKTGTMTVPGALTGKVNWPLLGQAVHVWRSNQRRGLAKAMTRGESGRTTAKVYRQKHTGRARHGARSAPIFVGGGVAHGPTGGQNYSRELPKKMSRAALVSALGAKLGQGAVFVVSGLEKLEPKVKSGRRVLESLGIVGKPVVIAPEKKLTNLGRAFGNLDGVTTLPVGSLNSYQVLSSRALVLTPESIKFLGKSEGQKKGKKE